MRKSWRILGLLSLVLASCSTSTTDELATQPAADAEPAAQEAPQEEAPQEEAPQEEAPQEQAPQEQAPQEEGPSMNDVLVSPINEALGFDLNDRAAANNAFINAAEERVQSCMLAAGFEYTPQDTGFAPSFERQLELEASLTPEQFTEQYGYGIATLFELNFEGQGVLNFVESLLGPPPSVERSDAEQEAYDRALSGRTIVGLSAEDAQSQAFDDPGGAAPGSCRQIGYDEAENPQGEIFDGLQSLLGDELASLQDRIESDNRLIEARRDWQRCMADGGFAFERPQEIRQELQGSANDLGDRFTQSPEALQLFAQAISANLASMDGPARFDFLDSIGAFQGFSMVPDLQVELDALIDYELEVANRSFDCTDRDLVLQVRYEAEQAFVEAHAEQLTLIKRGET